MRNKTTARAAGLLLALWQVFWLSSCGTPPPAESGAAGPGSTTSPITAAPAVPIDAPTSPASSASAAEKKPTTTASNSLTTEIEHPASTTTGTTRVNTRDKESVMEFSTLEAYEEKVRTLTTREQFQQKFLESSLYGRYTLDEQEFEMLLQDRYFLLPVLPDGCTVTHILFYGYGISEFVVSLPDGNTIGFGVKHEKEDYPKDENGVETTLTNERGLTVTHSHISGSVGDTFIPERGDYYWKENGYPCRMSYDGPALASYEAFIKALSFKKIPL